MEQPIPADVQDKMVRYEALKIQVREAEDEMERLRPEISAHIPFGKNVVTEKGYFYLQARSKYTYSEAVQIAEKNIKKHKKEEEANGIATEEKTYSLYYKTGQPEEIEE